MSAVSPRLPDVPSSPSRRRRSPLRLAAVVAALLVLGVLLPPLVNLNRYRAGVAAAMGRALDREVAVGSVSLRLLPQPGFHLQQVVIHDDPSISPEPMLLAPEVIAVLRLSSLWRGRLEIGRLSFTYPSLNLARSSDGRWNLEALLARASAAPSEPAERGPEARARFPYVEAQGGRVNLKLGDEKQVYALNQADFSLWQSGEDEWGLRLRAVPVRTDIFISDTGVLRLSGSFHRSGRLQDARLRARLDWEGAQLGQATRLLYGRDRGWRGAISARATVDGTPAELALTASASVSEFRRHDIVPADSMALEAHCTALYSAVGSDVGRLECQLPFGAGALAARGSITLSGDAGYDLTVSAENLPVAVLAALARRAKHDLPADLTAAGLLDGEFTGKRTPGAAAQWRGQGELSNVHLRSRVLRPELRIARARFTLEQGASGRAAGAPAGAYLALHPLVVPLGGATAATAQGWFSSTGYALHLYGDAAAPRVTAAGRALGLTAAEPPVSGAVRLDLRVTGVWQDFPPASVTGSARLLDVSAQVPGVAVPLRIREGTLALAPATVTLRGLKAGPEGSATEFSGWARAPRGCASLADCPVEFELRANLIGSTELNALLNPRLLRRPWYRFIRTRRGAVSPLTALRASGRLHAAHLHVGALEAADLSAKVEIAQGVARFSAVRATVFGGRHSGDWQADFTGANPQYRGEGRVQHVRFTQLAGAMRRHWEGGTLDAIYTLSAAGSTASELLASSEGTLSFDWQDALLHSVPALSPVGDDPGPLRLRRFRGALRIEQGSLLLSDGDLEAADGRYRVSGAAGFDGALALRLVRDPQHAFTIGGTLQEPRVNSLSPEQIEVALRE